SKRTAQHLTKRPQKRGRLSFLDALDSAANVSKFVSAPSCNRLSEKDSGPTLQGHSGAPSFGPRQKSALAQAIDYKGRWTIVSECKNTEHGPPSPEIPLARSISPGGQSGDTRFHSKFADRPGADRALGAHR